MSLEDEPLLVEINSSGEYDASTPKSGSGSGSGSGGKKDRPAAKGANGFSDSPLPPSSGGPRLGKLQPLGEPRRRKKKREGGEEEPGCCGGGGGERQRRKEEGGLRWGPIIMMMLVFGPAVLPALIYVWDKVAQSDWGISVGLSASPRDRLIAFYKKHNPGKLGEVDKVLRKYKGKTDVLFKNLEAKYAKIEAMRKEEEYYRQQDEREEPNYD